MRIIDMTKTKWRGIILSMPTYRKCSLSYLGINKVDLKPLGWRGRLPRKVWGLLPYFTGDNLSILSSITKTMNGDNKQFENMRGLWHSSGLYLVSSDGKWRQVSHNDVITQQIGNTQRTKIDAFIGVPGHYILGFTFAHDKREVTETVVEFNAHSKDITLLNLAITLLSLLIGGIIGWILAHI